MYNCRPQHPLSTLFVISDPFVSLTKQCTTVQWKFPHLREADCYTVNLPISASIGNECVKGPCQDTIAALWACNVRPTIGTKQTMDAFVGEKYNHYAKFTVSHLVHCRTRGAILMDESQTFLHIWRLIKTLQ